MLKPWEYLFKTHILARGWDYYENGAVSSLKKTETGYKATVEGSYDYEVEVDMLTIIMQWIMYMIWRRSWTRMCRI